MISETQLRERITSWFVREPCQNTNYSSWLVRVQFNCFLWSVVRQHIIDAIFISYRLISQSAYTFKPSGDSSFAQGSSGTDRVECFFFKYNFIYFSLTCAFGVYIKKSSRKTITYLVNRLALIFLLSQPWWLYLFIHYGRVNGTACE